MHLHKRIQRLIEAALAGIVLACGGCSHHTAPDLAARFRRSQELFSRKAQNAVGKEPGRRMYQAVSDLLDKQSIAVTSGIPPQLASAVLITGEDRTKLVVYWVSDKFEITEAFLGQSEEHDSVIMSLPVAEEYLMANKQELVEGVVCHAVWSWVPDDSPLLLGESDLILGLRDSSGRTLDSTRIWTFSWDVGWDIEK